MKILYSLRSDFNSAKLRENRTLPQLRIHVRSRNQLQSSSDSLRDACDACLLSFLKELHTHFHRDFAQLCHR